MISSRERQCAARIIAHARPDSLGYSVAYCDMSAYRKIANALATSFLAGRLETDELVERGSHLLGQRWRWIRPLARRVVTKFDTKTRPRQATLTTFILADQGFSQATEKHELRLVNLLVTTPAMCPSPEAESWPVPAICSLQELADWLNVTMSQLDWFADLRFLERKQQHPSLQHYHYRPLTKRHGRIRLIEAPKQSLKMIQRQIHTGILDKVPPHDAVHGFRRGRSIKTFAQPHTGKSVVLKMDLQDFFPSISIARVQTLFRTVGYPERVADALAGLCSNAAPLGIWEGDDLPSTDRAVREVKWLYAKPHLPQGAPTSPTIANLCAYRLDCRLSALADAAGSVYTRYADDLAFSGDVEFARAAKRFQIHSSATVMEEGFRVHHRKTRVMRRGVCQRIAGIVVNEHLNVPRRDLDRLKALLTNCIRWGVDTQNRSNHIDFHAHLHGRVSYVESVNPRQGQKLRKLLDQIEW